MCERGSEIWQISETRERIEDETKRGRGIGRKEGRRRGERGNDALTQLFSSG